MGQGQRGLLSHIYFFFTCFIIFSQLLNADLTIHAKIVGPTVDVKEESVTFVEVEVIVVERDLKIVQRILLSLHTVDIILVLLVKVWYFIITRFWFESTSKTGIFNEVESI